MLLEQFHSEVRVSKTRQTADTYLRHVKKFLIYLQEHNISVKNLTQEQFQQYVVSLVDQNLAPSYVRLIATSAYIYMKWLHEQGQVVQDLRCPKLPSIPVVNPISIEEATLAAYSRVCKCVPEPFSTALLLLPVSGLRASELLELEIKGGIRVEPPWIILAVTGKGNKPREVPLLQAANPILRQYLKGWRNAVGESKWMFPNASDLSKHISSRGLRYHMDRCGKHLGIHLTPHTMRRTYLTMLHRHGVVGTTLARLAGHTDPNFTIQRYVTKRIDDLCSALEKIDLKM